jgi:hypothetical protein
VSVDFYAQMTTKSIPAGDPQLRGPGGVRRSADVARTKAIRDGFGNVEVQLEAEGMTRAEVAAEFTKPNTSGIYLDGTGTSKVVVHCSDGIYTPRVSPGRPRRCLVRFTSTTTRQATGRRPAPEHGSEGGAQPKLTP